MLLDAVVEAMLTPKAATITKIHEIYITKSTAADPDVKLAVKNVTWATMNVAEINGVLGSLYRNPYKPTCTEIYVHRLSMMFSTLIKRSSRSGSATFLHQCTAAPTSCAKKSTLTRVYLIPLSCFYSISANHPSILPPLKTFT